VISEAIGETEPIWLLCIFIIVETGPTKRGAKA
jgi:hypothetical protein